MINEQRCKKEDEIEIRRTFQNVFFNIAEVEEAMRSKFSKKRISATESEIHSFTVKRKVLDLVSRKKRIEGIKKQMGVQHKRKS